MATQQARIDLINDLVRTSIDKINEGKVPDIQTSLEDIIRAYCQLKTIPVSQIEESIYRLCLIYRSKMEWNKETDLCLWATQQNGISIEKQALFQRRMDDARILIDYYSNNFDKLEIDTPMMSNKAHFLSLDNNNPMKVNFIRSFMAFKEHYLNNTKK